MLIHRNLRGHIHAIYPDYEISDEICTSKMLFGVWDIPKSIEFLWEGDLELRVCAESRTAEMDLWVAMYHERQCFIAAM